MKKKKKKHVRINGNGVKATITDVFTVPTHRTMGETVNRTVVLTTITTGIFKTGEKITFTHRGDGRSTVEDTISRIEIDRSEVKEAKPGANVGILLSRLSRQSVRFKESVQKQ